MLQNVANKIAPDETAAAGHENSHSAKYQQRGTRQGSHNRHNAYKA
jgi:hypothetical protein